MLIISKNGNKIEVTKGAYEEIYKRMGFELVEGSQEPSADFDYVDDSSEDAQEELDNELSEMLETPLSEMTKKELKQVADMLGIKVKGLSREEVEGLVAQAIQ